MWLKIDFDENEFAKRPIQTTSAVVSLSSSLIAPVNKDHSTFRVSPVFPLNPKIDNVSLAETRITFFEFENSFRVLGRVNLIGSQQLKDSTFFSLGLVSIIIISNDEEVLKEFETIRNSEPYATEVWHVRDSKITDHEYPSSAIIAMQQHSLEFPDYSTLPIAERAIVDEFIITIRLLFPKLRAQMPSEIGKITMLARVITGLIIELIYLQCPSGPPPEGLSEYSSDDLKDPTQNNIIRYQNLDRIIQVNSALSYVSTQAFSGAIPILERRSLVRRNSLLGIGSAILALNSIARYIETSFSQVAFNDIITKGMAKAAPLPGTEILQNYDYKNWHQFSINSFEKDYSAEEPYFKLPYFSGRLGFRETEFSIASALQSISSGAGLEWSLMTLTHEMLHGHVRKILSAIFLGDPTSKDRAKKEYFHGRFAQKIWNKLSDEKQIDSVRNAIFLYCCMTVTHGSLTILPHIKDRHEFRLLTSDQLWKALEIEHRNINEIFVHILDLNYFYASRISVYIPLIWSSWCAVPHINGDLRQYILRSLMTISSTTSGDAFQRFKQSVARLTEILKRHSTTRFSHPIINQVIEILKDSKKLMDFYFPSFKASLIMVDLVSNVFTSQTVHKNIFDDRFFSWGDEEGEDGFEKEFKYELPDGFVDEAIGSPLLYLLDKMIKELRSEDTTDDLERQTTLQFLALNSNN